MRAALLRPSPSPLTIVRGLAGGFLFVILLIATVGTVALQKVASVRQGADRIVDEQLLASRLLQEVQGEEKALTEVLYRATRLPSSINRDDILLELDRTDSVFGRLAKESSSTPDALVWRELLVSTSSFTAEMRRVLRGSTKVAREEIDHLLSLHSHVLQLSHKLLATSTSHLQEADRLIENQARELSTELSLVLGASLLLAAGCAAGTLIYARRSIRKIELQSSELDKVSWHMLQSQETTARRFSHELHDELGQSLAAIRSNLTLNLPEDDPLQRRADCVQLVDDAIENVRFLSQLLRPVILDDFGLAAGLGWLCEGFQVRTNIAVSFKASLDNRLHSETETHLFRIAQEALTNVARHSEASTVEVSLERIGQLVRLLIQDNGLGLPANAGKARHSLGLVGMRARARECGGSLVLSAVEPSGLRIVADVPARPPENPVEES